MLEAHIGEKIQEALFGTFQLRAPELGLLVKSVREMAESYMPSRLTRRLLPDGSESYSPLDISGCKSIVLEKLYFENEHTKLYKINQGGECVLWKVDRGMNAVERKEEAILQCIVKTALEACGYIGAVPKIYPCVIHPDWGAIVCMEGIPNAIIASKYLSESLDFRKSTVQNDLIILEIIIQLAVYLEILQQGLGFLHGDLKSNNILLIDPLAERKQIEFSVTNDGKKQRGTFEIQNQVLLIDYGFSSLGNSEATTGTDMFLYLATLWRITPFRTCVTADLINLFRKWLTFNQSELKEKEWWKFLEANKDTVDLKFTHFQTMREGFVAGATRPQNILSDIYETYGGVLKSSTPR